MTYIVSVQIRKPLQYLFKKTFRHLFIEVLSTGNILQNVFSFDVLHDLKHFIFEVISKNLNATHEVFVV